MEKYISIPLSADDAVTFYALFILGTIIIFCFLILALMYLVAFFKSKPSPENELTKIIGGLSLLFVAIIAANTWIYVLAFFISGLLIASERFMVVLAAILNSDRKNVHKIPSFFNLGPTEIEEKHTEEAEDSLSNQAEETLSTSSGMESSIQDRNPESDRKRFNEKLDQIKKTEKYLLNNFERNLANDFGREKVALRRYVRIKTDLGPIAYDAILAEPQTHKILLGVEITHLNSMRLTQSKRAIEQAIRKYKAEFPLLISVIFTDYDPGVAAQLVKFKNLIRKNSPDIGIIVYQMVDGKVSTINDEDLGSFLKTVIETTATN